MAGNEYRIVMEYDDGSTSVVEEVPAELADACRIALIHAEQFTRQADVSGSTSRRFVHLHRGEDLLISIALPVVGKRGLRAALPVRP